jgi:hypothetical protein
MLRLRNTTLLALPLLLTPFFVYSQASDSRLSKSSPAGSPAGGSSDQTPAPTAAAIPSNAQHMSRETRLQIIRDFEAQVVYARTAFPMDTKGLQLKEGVISPNGEELQQALTLWGPAIKPGDPAQISFVRIRNDHIQFEINGGPMRRKKWYQRIEVTGAYGQPVPTGPSDPQTNPHGSYVNLYFDKYVPEMTEQQLRALLYPVLDFNARSKEQAYLDTVPPKVKEAILAHHVLVGMNSEMVLHAKGKAPKKVRERDGATEYEEWIYGEPPADVDFVRFVEDEVVRVETMKVGGEKIVRTEREVVLPSDKDKEAKKEPEDRPANAPSLRRPGEDSEDVPRPATGPSSLPPMSPLDVPQPPGSPNEMVPSR